jgi:RsiW-degrading membrane proteinase PrsW (M82 family)
MGYYTLNIVIILIFIGFYSLTMTVDNEFLYLGYEDIWSKITSNNKLPLQSLTFLYVMPIIFLLVYVIQRLKHKDLSPKRFIIASFLSIGIIYLLNYLIYLTIDLKVWNLYFYPREGTPARFFAFINIGI